MLNTHHKKRTPSADLTRQRAFSFVSLLLFLQPYLADAAGAAAGTEAGAEPGAAGLPGFADPAIKG